MKNIKNTMLLKKVCDFYWYDLSIKGNKIAIVNKSNKEFKESFKSIESALNYFIDTMKDTDNESDCLIWGKTINYIESL